MSHKKVTEKVTKHAKACPIIVASFWSKLLKNIACQSCHYLHMMCVCMSIYKGRAYGGEDPKPVLSTPSDRVHRADSLLKRPIINAFVLSNLILPSFELGLTAVTTVAGGVYA